MKMKVSVVIPTFNRLNDLKETLYSILKQNYLPSEVIVVVDKGGNYEGNIRIYNEVRKYFENSEINLKFIKNNRKNSLTISRNIGIDNAAGDIFMFLDDDVILNEDYINEVVNVFLNDKNKEIAGVTVNISSPEEKISTGRQIYRKIKEICRTMFFLPRTRDGKFLASGFPTFPPSDSRRNRYVECIYGCNMSFRREICQEFKFDENILGYAYMDDQDFAYRVARKYKILFLHNPIIYHKRSTKNRDQRESMKKAVIHHHHFFKKNFPKKMKNLLAYHISIVGLFVDCILTRDIRGFIGTMEGIYGLINPSDEYYELLKSL